MTKPVRTGVMYACLFLLFALLSFIQAQDIVTITYDETVTLRSLARQYFEEPNDWELILYYNGYQSLNELEMGTEIKIPVGEYRTLRQNLEQSHTAISKATGEGASILAKELLAEATQKQEEASALKTKGQFATAIRAAESSIRLAQQALEETEQKRLQSVSAVLTEKKGKVQSKQETEVVWTDTDRNQELEERERIRTLSNSTGEISFVDGSKLNLNENSLAVIEAMKQDVIKNTNSSSVVVLQGDIMAYLASQSQKNQVNVSTPGVETEIRSRKFRTTRDESEVTKIANYDGEIDVSAGGATVTIKKDEGTSVAAGAKPKAPVKLLPAPALLVPTPKQQMFTMTVAIEWEAVSGADAYSIEIAESRGFGALIAKLEKRAATTHQWKAPATGVYYLRLASFDKNGYVGPHSDPVEFFVGEDKTPPYLMIEKPEQGAAVFSADLTIEGVVEQGAKLTIDGDSAEYDAQGRFVQTVTLQPGTQTLRVRAIDPAGNASEIEREVTFSREDRMVFIDVPETFRINTDEYALEGSVKPHTELSINGQKVPISENQFSYLLNLGEGDNPLELKAMNRGQEESTQLNIIVDLTPPAIKIDDLPSYTKQNSETISGQLSEAGSLKINSESVELQDGNFSFPVPLDEGKNDFILVATDEVGNQSKTELELVRDSRAPEVVSYEFSKAETGGGELIQLQANVRDAGVGLARNANYRVEVQPGGGELSGVLALNAQRNGYAGSVFIPPGFSGKLVLKSLKVSDYLGNETIYP